MPAAHVFVQAAQLVCVPALGANVPAPHVVQLAVVDAVHVPVRLVPAGHDVVHDAHAVWIPTDGEYVPTEQPTHVVVIVPLQVPTMYVPEAQVLVRVVQAVCVPAVEYVSTGQVVQTGVVVDVHEPDPAGQEVVQAMQAV